VVAREWHAVATSAGADAYADYFRSRLLPALAVLPGFVEAVLLRRLGDDGVTEVVVLSIWESMEAVRGFAGGDVSRAVVEPDAARLLSGFDESVSHFEVAATSRDR
jgi:heme-degrading monooxygenase HmoA